MTTKEVLEKFSREEGIALYNEKKTYREVYDILVSKGLTDSFETFFAEAMKALAEETSKMSKDEILKLIDAGELSDSQLEKVSGGSFNYPDPNDLIPGYDDMPEWQKQIYQNIPIMGTSAT